MVYTKHSIVVNCKLISRSFVLSLNKSYRTFDTAIFHNMQSHPAPSFLNSLCPYHNKKNLTEMLVDTERIN